MADAPESPRRKFRWRLWLVLFPLLLIALPTFLIYIAGICANHTRIPPELEKPPQIFLFQPQTTAITTTTSKAFGLHIIPAHRVRAETDTTNYDYPAFLEAELRDNPNLEGARKYLELSRWFKDANNREDLYEFNIDREHGGRLWNPGKPLPVAIADWLTSHTELVARFIDFANTPGLPVRSIELIAADPRPDAIPSIEYFTVLGVHVLSAEGERRVEAGDIAGAETAWRAAIQLSIIIGREPQYWRAYAVSEPLMAMARWLDRPITREQLLQLRAQLDEIHRSLFPPGGHSEYMRLYCSAQRKELIASLNQPWNSRVFGWDFKDRYHEFFLSTSFVEVPRLDVMAYRAALAIKTKSRGAQIVREFDQNIAELTRMMTAPWAEIVRRPPVLKIDRWAEDYYRGFVSFRAPYHAPRMSALLYETRFNLFRAAVEHKLNSQPPPRIADRESPWRDPYTELPLQTIETTSHTLRIYSPGPDLIDQHAQIEYDPTNTTSPGDVLIEIKQSR
ncbi:hypothetical protein LLG95_18155 [bacterium]|nr:hypothetical protein [bacterium]